MQNLTCISKNRDKNNKIISYTLINNKNNEITVPSLTLKTKMEQREVYIDNLQLTKDKRIIDKKKQSNKINIPSMYGIQLKKVENKIGKNGTYYIGEVYLDGQFLGKWEQDQNGALSDVYGFDENCLLPRLNKFRQDNKNSYLELEDLMMKIVVLNEEYSWYKNALNNGFDTMLIVTDADDYEIVKIEFNKKEYNNIGIQNRIKKAKNKFITSNIIPIIKIYDNINKFIIN